MDNFDVSRFDNGASYLVSDDAYKQYVKGSKNLGRTDDKNGNLFCAPRDEIDKAIQNSGGDIHQLETELGLDEGTFGEGPVHRVDINNPSEHNLREATGNETGANCFFNTPRDENGNLPNVEFCKETDGKSTWTAHDSAGREIIDADKTNPGELAKLNGRYATNHGDVHEPDTTGYSHTTSGGTYEGVTDQIPNTPENVSHSTISGWGKGEAGSLSTAQDKEAYVGNFSDLTPSPKQNNQQEQVQTERGDANQQKEQGKLEASSGMPTTAAPCNQDRTESSSSGMPTTAAGQSVSAPSSSSGQSQSSGQSM